MLVLSRKIEQRIVIGQGIEIIVLAIGGNRVRLGINAPADVSILRAELERHVVDVPLSGPSAQVPETEITSLCS